MEQEFNKNNHAPEDRGVDETHRNPGLENPTEPDEIVDLVDVIEDDRPELRIPDNEELRSIIVTTTERIARELFPDIAAPIIREEIEKLKRDL